MARVIEKFTVFLSYILQEYFDTVTRASKYGQTDWTTYYRNATVVQSSQAQIIHCQSNANRTFINYRSILR